VVSLCDDSLMESDESVVFDLSSPVNATLGITTASVTIVDDDL